MLYWVLFIWKSEKDYKEPDFKLKCFSKKDSNWTIISIWSLSSVSFSPIDFFSSQLNWFVIGLFTIEILLPVLAWFANIRKSSTYFALGTIFQDNFWQKQLIPCHSHYICKNIYKIYIIFKTFENQISVF